MTREPRTERHQALAWADQSERQACSWPPYGTPGAAYIPRQRSGLPVITHYRRPSLVLAGIKRLALWASWLAPWAVIGVLLAWKG
jgi:hypothetical protein